MEEQTVQVDEQINNAEQELALLKKRATLMGITFSPNIGLETLKNRIKEKMTSEEQPEEVEQEETVSAKRKRIYKEQMRLVRIRLQCLDPKKKDWPGEIFTVANKYLGTVKKFVPYNQPDVAYHVPYCIYNVLKNHEFVNFRARKLNSGALQGQQIVETTMAKSFAIEVLPPLTKEELADLAKKQAAANSIG